MTYRNILPRLFACVAALLLGSALSHAVANATSTLLDPASADPGAFRTDRGAVPSVVEVGGAKALRIDIPGEGGYPGVDLPGAPWNLSAYAGIEVEASNVGANPVVLAVRVDNRGDWQQRPWNTEQTRLNPGESRTVRVTFGRSHNTQAYALDASAVSAVKLFTIEPRQPAALLIKSVRTFGAASAAPTAAAPAAPAPAPAATPAPAGSSPLVLPATPDSVAEIRSEQGAVATLDTSAGAPAVKVEFPAGSGYPGVNFPLGGASIDLSAYNGVEVELTNVGSAPVRPHLRVDNPGDWRQSPWNVESTPLAPGETKILRVFFGRSNGRVAYALDPARVSSVKLFAATPASTATVLVKRLAPFTGQAPAPQAAAAPAPAPALTGLPETNSEFSPPISGELIDLDAPDALTRLRFNNARGSIADGKLTVVFSSSASYPNVYLPIPQGGWDLSAFAGIELTLHNPGTQAVSAYLRADNPPNERAKAAGQNPWNTQRLNVKPGETATLRLVFGENNGAPGYQPHAGRISAIQLFLNQPKQDTTFVISDIKAWGSASDRSVQALLTSPADRDTPVTPPAWLGTRPPVEGDWVQTLDENFDGDKLDERRWATGFPWGGLQASHLDRKVPENVLVSDGSLRIRVEKRGGHHNDDPSRPWRDYASGMAQTYDKWTQAYGYLEARIKLPSVRGLWPAFWTMPDRGRASGLDMWQRRSTGADNGKGMEIDIMEHLCEWGPGRHNAALHWDGYGANHKAWGTAIFYGPTPDGWHHFGLLWEPGKLTWYIDGKKAAEHTSERVTDVPAYLKLDIQVGGWASKDVDDAKLPAEMLVDYVRAWQLRERLKK